MRNNFLQAPRGCRTQNLLSIVLLSRNRSPSPLDRIATTTKKVFLIYNFNFEGIISRVLCVPHKLEIPGWIGR